MSGIELICMTMIGLMFGALVCYGGYRLFLVLVPIWCFFWGFGLGIQTVQALLGDGTFATITSWVVGFVVAVGFALLSYLFYAFAVALIAGWLGYAIGVGIMTTFMDFGLIPWIVGMAAAIGLIVLTFRFNLAKYVIILGTAIGGAALVLSTMMVGPQQIPLDQVLRRPIQTVLDSGGWFLLLLFLALAISGAIVQWRASQWYTIEEYDNWSGGEAYS
jgi:hypothetical protein